MTTHEVEAELTALGVEDCQCDMLVDPDFSRVPCVVCGEDVRITVPMSHIHFKGQMFHEYCLLLTALRQKYLEG